ncbi:MAG: deoxyribodipyrimidine photo-lyase [Halodesulfurarchaeum sp.]
MTGSEPTLFWHRRDLRTVDNRGLAEAARTGPVLPDVVLDPDLLEFAGDRRRGYYLASLASLQGTYRTLGTDLEVRWGDPRREIPAVAASHDATRMVWNRDYSKRARERDEAVKEGLPEAVSVTETADMALHEPGSIRTTEGEHYSVFSPYYEKWVDRDRRAATAQPDPGAFLAHAAEDVMAVAESPADSLPLPAGRQAARGRLNGFLDGPIYGYAEKRDQPAAEGTSRLSQDLAVGTLGVREVHAGVDDAEAGAETTAERESVEAYRRQLAWRDFYVQVLAAHPETVVENFRSFENPIEWRNDPAAFETWTNGETGYPVVDAGMRQLQAEAYMHNRVRMIVASFLTKDLQIDWREGYRHFREHLLDHETANDVGGWQWAASTGTDAQPYFRIFNPMTQGERYDPEAEYIKHHVPELRDLDPGLIHSWPDIEPERREALAPGYPDPIVDHAQRREETLEMFERARGD